MKYIIVPSILLSVLATVAPVRAGSLGVPELFVKGVYNHARHGTTGSRLGFKSNTKGVMVGAGLKLSNAMTVGIGYGYADTSVDEKHGQDSDIDSHQAFLYGRYQPNAWYANWMVRYSYGHYENEGDVQVKSKYHTNSYDLSLKTGYQFDCGVVPEAGVRYAFVDRQGYHMNGKRFKRDRNDLLAGLAGLRYEKEFPFDKVKWIPRANVAATYDFVSDKTVRNINTDIGYYQLQGRRMHRFGGEAGVGLIMSVGQLAFSVDYHGVYRKDFKSHTGMLSVKYNF